MLYVSVMTNCDIPMKFKLQNFLYQNWVFRLFLLGRTQNIVPNSYLMSVLRERCVVCKITSTAQNKPVSPLVRTIAIKHFHPNIRIHTCCSTSDHFITVMKLVSFSIQYMEV